MLLADYSDRFRHIAFARTDGVLEMRLHRAGDVAQWDFDPTGIHHQLGEAFAAVAGDPENRVVILTGTGDRFLTELDPASGGGGSMDARFWHRIYREGMALITNLLAIEVPMIAAVNGDAFIHAELPVLCDIVLAASGTRFADKAHFPNGVVPGDGVQVIWPMLLGPNRGRHFLLTGTEINALEAQRIGFVAEVLEPDLLLDRARALARDIASRPLNVLRHTRKLLVTELQRRLTGALSEGLMLEGMALLETMDKTGD